MIEPNFDELLQNRYGHSMKPAKFACCRALCGIRPIGIVLSLWMSGDVAFSEPAQVSAAPDLVKAAAPAEAKPASKPGENTEIPTSSGHTDWSRGDLFGLGSLWGSSTDFVRPNSSGTVPPVLDYAAQKKLWEKMDQHRHWMFGNSSRENGLIPSENSLENREFDPKSDLPKSVLQKRAMDEILHPATRSDGGNKNRRDSGMLSDNPDETVAGRGLLDSQSARGSSDMKALDNWALRNATESRSWLDWDRRTSPGASDFGQSAAAEIAKDTRDRTRRFDDMFGTSAATGSGPSPERDPRGWSTSSEGFTTRRERLERLFDSTTPPGGPVTPLAGSGLNSSVLGQAQRNELFGDGKTGLPTAVRRSKSMDEASKRPVFQPQPGELPLPKPNGN